MSTGSEPTPNVIPNHGAFDGFCIGATAMVPAVVLVAWLIANLSKIAATMAIDLSNRETAIQQNMQKRKDALWNEQHPGTGESMKNISDKIADGGTLSLNEQSQIQVYNSQLAEITAIHQAAIKEIDPSLTTMESLPEALAAALTELIQECSAVTQGQINTAKNKII